jgi:hypothetical protein
VTARTSWCDALAASGRHLAETGIIDDAIVSIRSWQPGQGLARVEEFDTLENELTERCVEN